MNDTTSTHMNAAYKIGNEVDCTDGQCGNLVRVIVNPVARTVTHLVVEPNHSPDNARLVPVGLVDADSVAAADTIRLTCDHAGFEALERAQTEDYLPGEQDGLGYSADQSLRLPYFPYGGAVYPTPDPATSAAKRFHRRPPNPEVVTYDRVPLGDVQIRLATSPCLRGRRRHRPRPRTRRRSPRRARGRTSCSKKATCGAKKLVAIPDQRRHRREGRHPPQAQQERRARPARDRTRPLGRAAPVDRGTRHTARPVE